MSAAQRLAEALEKITAGPAFWDMRAYAAAHENVAEAILAADPELEAALSLGLRLMDENDQLLVDALFLACRQSGTPYPPPVIRVRRALTEQLASQTGDQT